MELMVGGGQGRDKQGFCLEIDATDLKELGGQKNWKVGCILDRRNLHGQKYVDGNETGCLEWESLRWRWGGTSAVNAEFHWH